MTIDYYPRYQPKPQATTCSSVIKMILALQTKPTSYKPFLTRIVSQAIIRCCSHPLKSAVEQQLEDVEPDLADEKSKSLLAIGKTITYENYIPLWKTVLNVTALKEFDTTTYPIFDRQNMLVSLYDEMIDSILHIIDRLDLRIDKDKTDVRRGRRFSALLNEDVLSSRKRTMMEQQPLILCLGWSRWNRKISRSFTTSLTFVSKEKSRRMLKTNSSRWSSFEIGIYYRTNPPISFKNGSFVFSTTSSRPRPSKWSTRHQFSHSPPSFSSRYPLVSGLYRFATLVMNICLKLNYFQVRTGRQSSQFLITVLCLVRSSSTDNSCGHRIDGSGSGWERTSGIGLCSGSPVCSRSSCSAETVSRWFAGCLPAVHHFLTVRMHWLRFCWLPTGNPSKLPFDSKNRRLTGRSFLP